MYDPRHYDRPPVYSPHFTAASDGYYTSRSVHSSPHYSHHYTTAQPEPMYTDGIPQHFYRWFSPPGIVKMMQGTCVLLCFVIFACVASTLVWDMHGLEANVGGYVAGGGFGYGSGVGVGTGSGYYGGTYGYHSSYMTPYSAKSAMISVAAINFIIALIFLVASFSKTRTVHGRRFYLTVLVVDVSLAILQCIINIIFVIGVNPMAQSSQSVLYNPILMMCQSPPSTSISGGAGAGFPGAYPMLNQYLHHYCYMDPEEAVALVCGLLVMVALITASYFSYKTRSKIWRHGKANIIWEELFRGPEGREASVDWLTSLGSTLLPSAVVASDKSTPDVKTEASVVSYPERTVSVVSGNTYDTVYTENILSAPPEPLYQDNGLGADADAFEVAEVQWSPDPPSRAQGQASAAPGAPNGAGGYSTTGMGKGPQLVDTDNLTSMYPEITSDAQRQQYRREFDLDLAEYKRLCAEMDDINDQMNKLSRELDTLQEGSTKFQAVAEEYNRLKDLKRAPDYQSMKQQCKELKQKLSHIKRLVREYDEGYS